MHIILRNPWKTALLIGTILGLGAAILTMYAAWQHNPQGEFHEGSVLHWMPWLYIGASWFVVVGLCTGLCSRVVLLIANRLVARGAAFYEGESVKPSSSDEADGD